MGNHPYSLLMRYEGWGIWEVLALPSGRPVSSEFSSLVRAHHQHQLSLREENAFQDVGLERAVFFHVYDVKRCLELN